jgi:hypothetical protein
MPADNVLAEALARIEHKLDRLLDRQLVQPIEQLGARVACPVCKQKVDYQVDQINKVIVRKCGCKTGLQAPMDLSAFAPPASAPRKDNLDGAREDREDGSNAPADRRHPVR